jgi:16S rRNA (guanine966-N2)-methyltransferase
MHIIAGIYRQRKLSTPKGAQTRPTASHLRGALFNICQGYIEGARFLDLFAGSGAVGLEALSRGAQAVTFVENNKNAIACIQQNIQTLNVKEHCHLLQGDALRSLEKLQKKELQFDIIFADPPYFTGTHSIPSYSQKLIRWIDENSLLAADGILFVEEAFEFQPHLEDLKTLVLKNSRRMSSAALQQYTKR